MGNGVSVERNKRQQAEVDVACVQENSKRNPPNGMPVVVQLKKEQVSKLPPRGGRSLVKQLKGRVKKVSGPPLPAAAGVLNVGKSASKVVH
ncbi:hypothetical protein K0U07_00850 [bacterium]|nr:hypothetical protein [bacterium]